MNTSNSKVHVAAVGKRMTLLRDSRSQNILLRIFATERKSLHLLLVVDTFFSIVHGSRMHSEQNFYSS